MGKKFWATAVGDVLSIGAMLAMIATIASLVTVCAGPAPAAVPPGAVPSDQTMAVHSADLEPGVRIHRVAGPDGEVCYVVVGEMGGMASGRQAAVACL